jgi:hypothetical protein
VSVAIVRTEEVGGEQAEVLQVDVAFWIIFDWAATVMTRMGSFFRQF